MSSVFMANTLLFHPGRWTKKEKVKEKSIDV